jgi:tetratricopeptide (TPR) repeat protein
LEDPAAVYNAAMQAFQSGDFGGAIANFNKILAAVTDPKQTTTFGPLYYTLGAAYFNLPDYKKAVATFKLYLEKFPNDSRANEVRLALARAYYADKDYENANKVFSQLATVPQFRDQALTAQSQVFKDMNKPEEAIKALEELIKPEIRRIPQATGGTTLAEMYAEKGDAPKAIALVTTLQGKIDLIDNVIGLNALTVQIGDKLSENSEFTGAIEAYRLVQTQDEIVKEQKQRLQAMARRMEANLKAAAGNAQAMIGAVQANNELANTRESLEGALTEFEKSKEFSPGVMFRIGKCWYDMGKPWESIVVFDQVMKKYPDTPQTEAALYALISVYAELERVDKTQELCTLYLKDYPQGPNAGTVGYISGAVAMQAGQPDKAETFFGIMLDKQPDTSFKEQIRFMLGNAKFMQGKYDDARKDYEAYLKDFPNGESVEEANYRLALVPLFSANYEDASRRLNAYLGKYPQGSFSSDAKYRLMVAKYAEGKYDEVVADAKAWRSAYVDDPMEGEVLSLYGDTLVAQNKNEEAIPIYIESYKKANTDEVLNYSLFEASKHMQKLGQWEEMSKMFEEFVKEKPNHAGVVTAMYWISKARARQGRQNEAKAFLVETLKQYIDQPHREAVEQLLSQLAQLCMKRPPAPAPATPPPAPAEAPKKTEVASTASATPAAAVPPPIPPPPPYDADAELDIQLEPLRSNTAPVAKARILYAQAELKLMRKKTADRERLLQQIADDFQPAQLSPVLLATVGDYLLSKGNSELAFKFYSELMNGYPQSDYLDFAYVGLGQIALARKDYNKALPLFTHAADVIASSKVKDATVGKARTLLELGKYEEAKKLFELITNVREWRGESTALAVYSLGDLEQRQGNWAEAIARYQRVFVLYQKYLPWVAQAYIKSAQCFEKLGKRPEAIGHLREMLRNEKLANFPETQEARKMLQEWGEQA